MNKEEVAREKTEAAKKKHEASIKYLYFSVES